jgi:hypothetical protein
MTAGLASLVASRRIVAMVGDGWSALAAPAILGTWLLFVREHHHGLWDAPAAGAAMLALWAATAHVRAPSIARIAAAGALAGLATSFKYNLAPTVPAVAAAAFVVGREWRVRTVLVAGFAALLALVLTTPEIVIEHGRWRAYFADYIPLQHRILTSYAGAGGNRLVENVLLGIGWIGLGLAGLGVVVSATARERLLVPVLAFVALYGVVLVTTPLALVRYVLPVAGPVAVLVAFGLSRLPRPVAIVLTLSAIAVGAPACIRYVRFLGIEDTRVEAARVMEEEWSRGGRALVAVHPIQGAYASPDVAHLPRYDPALPPSVIQAIAAREPRCAKLIETLVLPKSQDGEARGAEALLPFAGALVVTVDAPTPTFQPASTPPDVAALLEREATLVVDLQVERAPAERVREVLDLNYVPFTGVPSLVRPGPRVRVWRVPTR